jgi:hypothetical protein
MWWTLNWSRFLLTTSLVQAFTTYNGPPWANENRPHIVRFPQIGKAVSLASLLPLSSARGNTRSDVDNAVTPPLPPTPPTHKGSKDDTVFFHPHNGSTAAAAAWLDQGAVLASVLVRIVGASLQPQMWPMHWDNSHRWILVALSVAQAASAVSTGDGGGLLPAVTAVQVIGAAFLLRCYVLPAVYASLLAVSWTYLCHGGHVRRMLHDVYILAPWWFSNKLFMTDHAEAQIPDLLHTLQADRATVAMAHDFAHARRQERYRIDDATALAHHSGVLVLYTHAFGPAVSASPDWPHVVMHCCCGRILDDYQDMEEDVRDGNLDRNFFLLLEQQQPQQDAFGGTENDPVDDADNNHMMTMSPRMRMVVQAMHAMHWHEEQIMDPLVQQYARGVTKALEVMMLFKSRAFKRTWQEARAAAAAAPSSRQLPPMVWPFPSLVQTEGIAVIVRDDDDEDL